MAGEDQGQSPTPFDVNAFLQQIMGGQPEDGKKAKETQPVPPMQSPYGEQQQNNANTIPAASLMPTTGSPADSAPPVSSPSPISSLPSMPSSVSNPNTGQVGMSGQIPGGQPPRNTIGGLPGLVMGWLKPGRNVPFGQPIPSKMDRFEGFIGNFLQSLSAGFSQEGHGPGSFGRGFGAAQQAPHQEALQQYQMQQAQQKQQADIALEQQKIKAGTPSIPVSDPRTGGTINIAPADLGKYLAAGYRYKGVEDTNKSKETIADQKLSPAQKAAQDAYDDFKKTGDTQAFINKLQQAKQITDVLKPGATSPFGKLTPEMAATGMPPDYKDSSKYPLGMNDPKFNKDVMAYGKKVTDLKQGNAKQLAMARGESFAYGRAKYMQMPVLDNSKEGEPTLSFKTPLEIAANPGAYTPMNEGVRVMGKEAVFRDIQGASKNLRKAINNNKTGFNSEQVAAMTAAMDGDPSGGMLHQVINNLVASKAKDHLNSAQQDHAVAIQQAVENAYGLRGVAGFGTSGSDSLRAAIKATLPSASSPPGYAIKQLDAFDSQVNRLHAGTPIVKLRSEEGSTPAPPPQSKGKYSPNNPFAPK